MRAALIRAFSLCFAVFSARCTGGDIAARCPYHLFFNGNIAAGNSLEAAVFAAEDESAVVVGRSCRFTALDARREAASIAQSRNAPVCTD